MRKTKKFLVGLLACLTVGVSAVGLSACGEEGKKPANDGETVWTIDTVYAKAKDLGYEGSLEEFLATVKGEKGEAGVGIKEIKLNKLGELVIVLTNSTETNLGKIAGKSEIHTHDWEEKIVFHEATCKQKGLFVQYCASCDDEKVIVEDRVNCSYKEGLCIWCEDLQTKGLEYALNDEGTSYSLIEIGECKDTDIVIPAKFNGLPVTSIGNYAFSHCSSLTSITISNSVTSIGRDAFAYCSSLTSITIPNSVTSIGEYAFYNCESLTSIEIPNSVTSIGRDAFSRCSSLTRIEVGKGNTAYRSIDGNLYSKDGKTLIQYAIGKTATSFTTPNSVTSIGNYAFYNCNNLTSVTIGNGVTSIGDYAFYICRSLTSVTIGNSVTSIGYWAFAYCNRLVEVVNKSPHITVEKGSIENEYLGCYAFAVYNSEDTFTGTKLTNDNGYIVYTDGVEKILVGYFGEETALTLPSYITEINQYAFVGCSSLTSIKIPNSVTSIGDYAFALCGSLTSIEVGKENTAYQSIDGNLYSKDGKTLIQYAIGKKAISFEIPNGVTSIGNYAFYNCNNLTSVKIGDDVTSIGDWTFALCGNLTSITFKGMIGEWNKIEKGSMWNTGIPATKVVCTGGEVEL
ncbi:MAG: leucine-rich repeat domain-containing protein [Clostridia bacterium]|nr:leucine-rich repeat domain-containing protein [Clostridia bacterium]